MKTKILLGVEGRILCFVDIFKNCLNDSDFINAIFFILIKFRNAKKLRPWSRNVPDANQKETRPNEEYVPIVEKDDDESSSYEKEPIFTTRLIASSEEYIKDDTERSDSILFRPDTNDLGDISAYDFYSAPEASNQQPEPATSSFSPPNEIYFGFKPVVKG